MKLRIKMPEPRQIVPVLLCLVALGASAQSIGERLKDLVNPGDDSFSRYGILDPDQAFRLSAKPVDRADRTLHLGGGGGVLSLPRQVFVGLPDG